MYIVKGENMENAKMKVLSIIGLVGGIIGNYLGGWDIALRTLVLCMGIDYVTGLIVAGVFKSSPKTQSGALQSKAGFKGLLKKSMILIIILIAYRLDRVLDSEFIRNGVILAYLANEIISIIENAGLMGLYVPPILKKGIDLLAKQTERSDSDETTIR